MQKINADNQSYVIFFLGAALLLSIYCNMSDTIIAALTGGLTGMFMGKTINDHKDVIDEKVLAVIQTTIKEELAKMGGEYGAEDVTETCG